MPNIGGAKQPRRLLLASVVCSIVLYAAPIWATAMAENKSYGATCRRACRIATLRVASAYRTVSDIALSVITACPPVDLLAQERAYRYRERRQRTEDSLSEPRSRWSRATIDEWQRRWDDSRDGRWTHRIIPDVEAWITRRHGLVNFHLTQILTAHGGFRSYLRRFGIYDSAECLWCPGQDEDVEHVLFQCPRFAEERNRFREIWSGPLTLEGLGECLLGSEEGWQAAVRLAASITGKLQERRKAEERAGWRRGTRPTVPTTPTMEDGA